MGVRYRRYNLGLQLKVRPGTLDRIRVQFSDSRERLPEMLKTWLATGDNTSWKALTDVLKSQSVGGYQIADYLESKYCPMEDMRERVSTNISSRQGPRCLFGISLMQHQIIMTG